MAEIKSLFVTKLYRAAVEGVDLRALLASCRMIAAEDEAGRAWSKEKGYRGYTSYASLNDLPKRDPEFSALVKLLYKHAAAFARDLHFARGRKLKLESIWINVL
jgi:uncharacterized protein (TIGR02466 family)